MENDIKKLKEEYSKNPNKWVVYYRFTDEKLWHKCNIKPIFDDGDSEWKLILKEHEHIADAVIANPDVEVWYDWLDYQHTVPYSMTTKVSDFFNTYDKERDYRLAKPTSAKNTQVELTYKEAKKPIHGMGEEEDEEKSINCNNCNTSNKSNSKSSNNFEILSIKDDNGKENNTKNNEFLEAHGIIINDDLSTLESVSIKATDVNGKVLYEATNEEITLKEILQDVQDKQMSVDASELLIKAMGYQDKE